MVAPAAQLPDAPGIRLTTAELVALRDQVPDCTRQRPLTRRAGAVSARSPGTGMDLREIRAYVAGDDPRRLDPAATARTGQPHIRSLHEDRDDTLLLVADFRASMLWGTGMALRSVRAARHLALKGWQTSAQGGSVGLTIATGGQPAELSGGSGDRQMLAICGALASQHDHALATPAKANLTETLIRVTKRIPAGGRVLLATSLDGWQEAVPALAALARRCELSIALILDESEHRPPADPLTVSDGHHFQIVRLSPIDFSLDLVRLRALGASVVEVLP